MLRFGPGCFPRSIPNLFEAKQKHASLEPEERAFVKEFALFNQIDLKPCHWWDFLAQTDPKPRLKEGSDRADSVLAQLSPFESTPPINPGSAVQKTPCVSCFPK